MEKVGVVESGGESAKVGDIRYGRTVERVENGGKSGSAGGKGVGGVGVGGLGMEWRMDREGDIREKSGEK